MISKANAVQAILAEATRRAQNDPGVSRLQVVVGETELLHHARPVALDDDVGILRESEKRVAPLGGLQIDPNLLESAIRGVAPERRLRLQPELLGWHPDLDDARPEVGKNACAPGGRTNGRKVENGDAFESSGAVRHAEVDTGRPAV